MIYLRRIYRQEGQGFVINHDPSDPMSLTVGSGTYGNLSITATNISIPVSEVEQNVFIALMNDEVTPIHLVIGRNGQEPPRLYATCIMVLANFFVPPNCTDLKTLDIYVRGFVNDKLFETPFEGDRPVWEKVM